MPALKEQLVPILQAGMARPDVADSLTTWRNDWLDQRQQELVNIPDAITSQLRTELEGAAAARGTSVSDASLLVDEMLDDGYPSWDGRADLIARTETVGANNQGSLASMSAIADSEGLAGTKTWLATSDDKTRPDHAEVSGMSVALDATFDVGGVEMNGPGDNAGGAGQVCNCRCTLTYAFDDPSSTGGDNPGDNGQAGTDIPADLTAAAQAPPTGVAVMAMLSAEDAARASVADGEPPDAMHTTLGYLAKPAADYSADDQARIVSTLSDALSGLASPIAADAFATAHFNPDDTERDPCAVILVQSDDLAAAHDAVTAALGEDASTTFPIWIPHVTVAYNADPSVIPAGVAGTPVNFDRVVLGWAGQQIPLGVDPASDTGGDSMTAASEAPVTAPTDTATAPTPAPADATTAPAVEDEALEPSGVTWSGPIADLDLPSSDGRVISSTGGTIRPLPQPLSWQRESDDQHKGSVIVGRVLSVEPRGGQMWASGDYLDPNINFDVAQAMAQVDAGMGFVSVDLAVQAIGFRDAETNQPIDPVLFDGSAEVFEEAVEWEFGGVTIISFAAFADARITNTVPVDDAVPTTVGPIIGEPIMGTFAAATPEQSTISDDGTAINLPDGSTAAVGDPVAWSDADGTTDTGVISAINPGDSTVTVTPDLDDDDAGVQPPDKTVNVETLVPVPDDAGKAGMDDETSLLASSEIRPYKAAAFAKRTLPGPTPLTISEPDENGLRDVFGHLATWGECHLGRLMEGKCVTAPPAPGEDYSYFHLSDVQTDAGLLAVGKVTLGAGHAGRGSRRFAMSHYDNTATAVAVVRAFEDEYGIQVDGQIIHDTPAAKIEELMRSPLSGDWRGVDGTLRLTAALAVNTPGFPVRRPVIGMSGDSQISLVAAGVVEIPEGTEPDILTLPSGRTIRVDDFEALTAAAAVVMERRNTIDESIPDELAIMRARLRVNLAGRRRGVAS